jgi:hypothetical protein
LKPAPPYRPDCRIRLVVPYNEEGYTADHHRVNRNQIGPSLNQLTCSSETR